MKLTKEMIEVLELLDKENLTPQQVALRRGKHISGIYRIITTLRKKGILDNTKRGIEKNTPSPAIAPPGKGLINLKANHIRLHAIQIKLTPYSFGTYYLKFLGQSFNKGTSLIKIWKDAIELYIYSEFLGNTEEEAELKAFNFIYKEIKYIEDTFKLKIIKKDKQNIKIVNSHYAHVNNGIARQYNKEDLTLKVVGNDGKVWLIVDKSKGLDELECIHSNLADKDSRITSEYTNDWRDNHPPTNGQLAQYHKDLINMVGQHISMFNKLLSPQQQPETMQPEFIGVPEYIG